MFSSLGLFKRTKCPDIQNCKRTTCVFSHSQDAPAEPAALNIPIHAPKPQPQPQREKPKPTPSSSSLQAWTIPSKRTASELQTTNGTATVERPRKISKVGPAQNPGAVPTLTQTPVSSKPLDTRTATPIVTLKM
jgi:RNA exonuclease 1